jgi:hypothetical protein
MRVETVKDVLIVREGETMCEDETAPPHLKRASHYNVLRVVLF